jgi:hypothetical protein
MASVGDVAFVRKGEAELLDAGLADVAAANRKMLDPLLEVIRNAGQTGNDTIDIEALSKRIDGTIDEMDEGPIAEFAEAMLLQTYAISRMAAIPTDAELEIEATDVDPADELTL